MPSAPRLNLSGVRGRDEERAGLSHPKEVEAAGAVPGSEVALARSAWLKLAQEIVRQTEDVGERFPEEARKIHYGESAERAIRGKASEEQRAELADEGIEVLSIPLPVDLTGPVH